MKTFVTRDTTLYPIPSGYIFFDGFQKLGWKTFYVPPPSEGGRRLIDYDYGASVNILFDYQNLLSNPNHVEDLKLFKEQNPDCKIFVSAFLPYDHNRTTEVDKRFEQYRGVVDYFFNSTLQHNRAKKDFAELGFEYLCIPYPAIILPENTSKLNYLYDTCFVGTIDSGERLFNIWYPEIIKPHLKTYLAGFNGHPKIGFEEMIGVSLQTKINLNPHYLDQVGEDANNIHSRIDFNTRVFNLAVLGCFQLTNHPWFKTIFGEEYPIFDQYNFKDMLAYYLQNEEERIKIANSTKQAAVEKYTSEIFAQKISENNFNFI